MKFIFLFSTTNLTHTVHFKSTFPFILLYGQGVRGNSPAEDLDFLRNFRFPYDVPNASVIGVIRRARDWVFGLILEGDR